MLNSDFYLEKKKYIHLSLAFVIAINLVVATNNFISKFNLYIPYHTLISILILLSLFYLLFDKFDRKYSDFPEHLEGSVLRKSVLLFAISLLMNFRSDLALALILMQLSIHMIGRHYFETYGSLQGKALMQITLITVLIEGVIYLFQLLF